MTTKLQPSLQDQSPALITDSLGYNLYRYQFNAMPVLLGWGLGSLAAGLVWMRSSSQWLRGLGGQFVGWGAIDGLIAGFALRGAERNAARLAGGEISPAVHDQQAVQFERIVWLNAVLDIGYLAGGLWLLRRGANQPNRRGMGLGVLIQGAFLFVWDILLASCAQRQRQNTRHDS